MNRTDALPHRQPRLAAITRDELAALQRDRDILDWVCRDFERHRSRGPGLRKIVGDLLDAGADLSRTIGEAAAALRTRPAAPPPAEDPLRTLGPW